MRIQSIKDEKLAELNRNHELAIQEMIEKEKFYEHITQLKKQPEKPKKKLKKIEPKGEETP